MIFITALEAGSVEAEAERVGCVASLRKQFSGATLIAAIKALDRERIGAVDIALRRTTVGVRLPLDGVRQ